MSTVLVAYATKNGSTHEVAETVSATMREQGAHVDLLPVRDVPAPMGARDLIVLGAPIYSGRWHRDAHRFLRRHRDELANARVAVFGMGPREPGEEAWARSRAQLDRALAKRAWLHPVSVAVFGGVDPPTRSSKERRDQRNWDVILAWARDALRL